MAVSVYLFFSIWIAFGYTVQSNEENGLGQRTSMEENAHGVVTERAPYFINTQKMSKSHVKPAGNMISLKCKAGGSPTPNVTWYKNNEVPRRHLGNIRYGQWSLTLEDLVTDDSGTYRCVVCNYLGCIDHDYTVEVVDRYHNRPILLQPVENKTVTIGSNTNFTTSFLSDLNLKIYWLFGNTEIINSSENPEILELINVTHESEGWYTVVAANSMGVTNSSAYLTVVEKKTESDL